jgi:hypothetical protein
MIRNLCSDHYGPVPWAALQQNTPPIKIGDPKVTMRYAHLSTKALQAAANTASVLMPKKDTPDATPEAKEEEAIPADAPTAAILPFPRAA